MYSNLALNEVRPHMLQHALPISLHDSRTDSPTPALAPPIPSVIPHNHINPSVVIIVEPLLLSRHEFVITGIRVTKDYSGCLSVQPWLLIVIVTWNNHTVDLLAVK